MKSLYFNFAVKSLLNRAKQYRSLFSVSAVGVCIMISVLMITDGMLNSMTEKNRQYYGGDFMLLGPYETYDEALPVSEFLASQIPPEKEAEVSMRYMKKSGRKVLYFEGVGAQIRSLQGVNFSAEKSLFGKFTFVSGNAEQRPSHDGILLSSPVAKKLGVKEGDSIVLMLDSDSGYKNTVTLVVQGVFLDSSVFGMYTAYIDYDAMMKVYGFERPIVDRICVYYPKGAPSRKDMQALSRRLSEKYRMLGVAESKDEWQDYDGSVSGEAFMIIPLEANIDELQKVASALHAIVLLIVIMLVVIISVGISSTFRVIVMKRAVESGTFRALGMKPSGLMMLYFTEVLFLLITGCVIGMLGALLVTKISSGYNLSFISGFDAFLTGGHLAPLLNAGEAAALMGIILVTTLGAVLFTLRKLIHISPVGALATVS